MTWAFHIRPGFNGLRLDGIIDYITYAFLPCLDFVEFGILPGNLGFNPCLSSHMSSFSLSFP